MTGEAEAVGPPAAEYDEYGFVVPAGALGREIVRYKQQFQPKAERRVTRWERFRRADPSLSNRRRLKRLVRKGIPDSFRKEIWAHCLGSQRLRDANPNKFESLLREPLSDETLSQIELDLTRTFPNNKLYKYEDGVAKLRRVLRAFAVHNVRVNYCQSLNFIAAVLLLFMDEELAFWTLAQVVSSEEGAKGLHIDGYYVEGMDQLRADLRALERIVQRKFPNAYASLRREGVELEWVCQEWFHTLFSTVLPIQTTLRVWDCLFLEGHKILFRVALAIFKENELRISKFQSLEEVMVSMREISSHQVDHNSLLKAAFKGIGRLKRAQIRREQAYGERMVAEENAAAQARRERHNQAHPPPPAKPQLPALDNPGHGEAGGSGEESPVGAAVREAARRLESVIDSCYDSILGDGDDDVDVSPVDGEPPAARLPGSIPALSPDSVFSYLGVSVSSMLQPSNSSDATRSSVNVHRGDNALATSPAK